MWVYNTVLSIGHSAAPGPVWVYNTVLSTGHSAAPGPVWVYNIVLSIGHSAAPGLCGYIIQSLALGIVLLRDCVGV